MPRKLISLGLADDSPTDRIMMADIIHRTNGFKLLFEAVNGVELISKLNTVEQPDILIIDMYMPVLCGLESLKLLRTNTYCKKVILVSNSYHSELFELFEWLGADGYCQKNKVCLLECIDAVIRDKKHFQPFASSPIPEVESKENLLSPIHHKIISMLASGCNYTEIASATGYLGKRSIEAYTSKLIKHLGLKSREHLIAFAYMHGLIPTFEVLSSFNNKQQTTNNKQQTTNNEQLQNQKSVKRKPKV